MKKIISLLLITLFKLTAFAEVVVPYASTDPLIDGRSGHTALGLHANGNLMPILTDEDGHLLTATVTSVYDPIASVIVPRSSATPIITLPSGTQVKGFALLGVDSFGELQPIAVDGDGQIITGGGSVAVESVNSRTGAVTLTSSDVGLGNATNTSDANKPVSTAQQTALDLKANQTSISNLNNTSDANKPVSTAQQAALDLKKNLTSTEGIPLNVRLLKGNRMDFTKTKEGVLIQSYDSVTQTNTAGAFNGSGTGQKAFVGFSAFDTLAFSAFTGMGFTARYIDDLGGATSLGQVAVNVLSNFNSGVRTAADDYVNLVWDGGPDNHLLIFRLTTAHQDFSVNTTDRAWKAVSGTGAITVTGTTSIGSNIVTEISNPSALSRGMYFKKLPAATPDVNNPIPDGTTITDINVAGSTVTLSANATLAQSGVSMRQYGGIAPDTRAGVCNGTTTIALGNRTLDAVTTTADLQVGMFVSGTGVAASSYIVSMVSNVSITLNNACTNLATPTLAFVAQGKTGIPPNTEAIGIPWSRILANNANGYLANTAPITPTWTTSDGGFVKNIIHPAVNIVMGSTGASSTTNRSIVIKKATINGTLYEFDK